MRPPINHRFWYDWAGLLGNESGYLSLAIIWQTSAKICRVGAVQTICEHSWACFAFFLSIRFDTRYPQPNPFWICSCLINDSNNCHPKHLLLYSYPFRFHQILPRLLNLNIFSWLLQNNCDDVFLQHIMWMIKLAAITSPPRQQTKLCNQNSISIYYCIEAKPFSPFNPSKCYPISQNWIKSLWGAES